MRSQSSRRALTLVVLFSLPRVRCARCSAQADILSSLNARTEVRLSETRVCNILLAIRLLIPRSPSCGHDREHTSVTGVAAWNSYFTTERRL